MTTGYEVEMYRNIGSIAQSLNRIANCMEAAEKRARAQEATTPEDIERIGPVIQAVKRGFADLTESIRKESDDG
jgi:hypothetical protein